MQSTPLSSDDPPEREVDPDPPAHDTFQVGTLVAVAVDDAVAAEIVESARNAGARDAHLIDNTEVLVQHAHRKVEQGPLSALMQKLGALVSDQGALQDRYLDHARAGHPMIVATARDASTANRLWQVMREHGARDGTWYGPRVIHEMI